MSMRESRLFFSAYVELERLDARTHTHTQLEDKIRWKVMVLIFVKHWIFFHYSGENDTFTHLPCLPASFVIFLSHLSCFFLFCFTLCLFVFLSSESAGADTLSRIQRGCYEFPDELPISPEAKDFVSKV